MELKSKMDIQSSEPRLLERRPNKSLTEERLNVENAYRITERLAFPRLIGSEGEEKAIMIIVDEFEKAGVNQIHKDKFKTSFFTWIIIRHMFFPIVISYPNEP